jgi:integrase
MCLHLGYRRGVRGGSWLARRFEDGRYSEKVLGVADDNTDADGFSVMSYRQALDAARAWWQEEQRRAAGLSSSSSAAYSVSSALSDYFTSRERRGSRGVTSDRAAARARIEPVLGHVELHRLSAKAIKHWHEELSLLPRLVRTKAAAVVPATKQHDENDPDAIRARRATANRVLTILKAALNHAYAEGLVRSDDAWRAVRPFRGADSPVVRYLTVAEISRLLNACPLDFGDLVRGALATGCRYGELGRLKAGEFNPDSGTITVRTSKSGKPRHVVLTDEGLQLFQRLTAALSPTDLVFRRTNGAAWKSSDQLRPIAEASRRARIEPPATFHVLRHTHASLLAQGGSPLAFIAQQLGHADQRITSRNYAHLAPNVVAAGIRAAMPSLGLERHEDIVRPFKAKRL